jgi:riboflavin transporter FmnP
MVAPINLIKGTMFSVITMLIYKKISPIIKYGASAEQSVRAAE